jgi:peptidoglycan/xylan/chitin deacetylase (PgdA/CDA1 family)
MPRTHVDRPRSSRRPWPSLIVSLAVVTAAALGCAKNGDGAAAAAGGAPGGMGGVSGASGQGTGGSAAGHGGAGAGGGSMATVGASSGGAPGTGGRPGAGGSAAGGRVGAGGSGAGGAGAGGANASGVSGLPAPPGGGVAKPSGAAGNLTVLNWAGWKAAVSYTFDDTNQSQIDNYAALQALGVHLTFYLITGKSQATDPVWARAVADGHELGNHTKSHVMTATAADIDAATDFLEQTFGVTAWTMAAPFGDASYTPLASTRFLVNRGVSNGLMGAGLGDNTDPFSLFCYIPPQDSLASAFNDQIDAARTAGKWRVVLVHGFNGNSNDGAFQPVDIAQFTSGVAHTKSLGDVWIDSVVNVASYWRAQKTFLAVTPTTSGSNKTWTWTLPAHFPPGKYLRVTADGGTLTQGGNPLLWDAHGYYEVALDGGPLTLSP